MNSETCDAATKQPEEIGPPQLRPYAWKPGQSGNPSGKARETCSFAVALRKVGLQPAARADLSAIAHKLGLSQESARQIDVVAALFYQGLRRMLQRVADGDVNAAYKSAGLIEVLRKSLDGDRTQVSVEGNGGLREAMESVSAVLGFRNAAPTGMESATPCHSEDGSQSPSGG